MNTNKSRQPIRWLVRAGLGMIVLLLLIFAGSNLFLSTGPGQAFLQNNLNRRAQGISWQVAGASWSPWNGITVKRLTATLPNSQNSGKDLLPLLALQEIQLKPYWGQLLRGKKLFREVILDEPQLNLPVEMLFVVEPTKPTPPPAPKVSPPPATKSPQSPQSPQKSNPPKDKQPNKPKEKPKPKQPSKKTPPPKAEPKPLDEKRFWVRLRKAKVRLYSTKLDQSIEFHSFNANLPLGGPPTTGSFSWEKITLGEHLLTDSNTFPVEWKSPTWTLANQDLKIALPQLADKSLSPIPMEVRFGGSFTPRGKHRDFRFQATLPSQAIPDYVLHRDSRFHLRAKSVTANIAAQGLLLNPNTWRLDSSAALDEIEVFSELRGQHFHFETARARTNLRNTTLSTPAFSLRSERLSILGNGQLHLGGYLLGVARVVADPELNNRIRGIAIGSHIIPWRSQWLLPLETPDRYFRDFHFEGLLPNAMVNVGPKGEFLPVAEVIRLLRTFTKTEAAEELPPPQSPLPNNP